MEIPERREPPLSSAQQEQLEENRKIRRLQMLINMVMSVLSQDPDLTLDEAHRVMVNTKQAALAMFPDKEFAYDIIYQPRLDRLVDERFRPQ